MHENRPRTRPENNQNSKPTGFPLTGTRDPLFDNASAEIGVDQARTHVPNGPTQRSIGDAGLVCKPGERLGFEGSHPLFPGLRVLRFQR